MRITSPCLLFVLTLLSALLPCGRAWGAPPIPAVPDTSSRPVLRFPGAKAAVAPASFGQTVPRAAIATATPTPLADQIRRATDGVEFCGNITFALAPEAIKHQGIWRINAAGEFSPVHPHMLRYGECVWLDGLYYIYYVYYADDDRYKEHQLYGVDVYDSETWTRVAYASHNLDEEQYPSTLCTDGRRVYGQYWGGGKYKFGRFDPITSSWTFIADCDILWKECAFGNDGFIYCIDDDEMTHKVNPATGAAVKLGPTGNARSRYADGCIIDRLTGRMFRTYYNGYGYLCEIDLATGASATLCQFEQYDQVTGLFQPWNGEEQAPAPVGDMKADFAGGSLSGTVSFRCPTTLNDGSAATGPLTYSILLDGREVATGQSAFGQAVTVPLTVDSAGICAFAVSVTGDQGRSLSRRKILFVGNDTPSTPAVTASYATGRFFVNWTPSTGVNGGYLDTASLKYTVVRYPDSVVVAQVADTTFVDHVPYPDTFVRYHYTVQASCNGQVSGIGKSETVPLGSYRVPYLEPFDDASTLGGFRIADANSDGNTWMFGNIEPSVPDTCVCIKTNSRSASDDWLISPPVRLQGGKTYNVSADLMSFGATNTPIARIEVKAGRGDDLNYMTLPVAGVAGIPLMTTIRPENYVWTFTAPADDDYYFGMHALSPRNANGLNLDNLSVSGPLGAVPDSVSGLRVEFAATAEPAATLTARAPEKDIDGKPLSSISRIEVLRDGRVAGTLTDIAPGQTFTYVDRKLKGNQFCSWTLVCHNSEGAGRRTSATLDINASYAPAPVNDVQVTESPERENILTVSWTPPTTDIAGRPLGDRTPECKVEVKHPGTYSTTVYKPKAGENSVKFAVSSSQHVLDAKVVASDLYGQTLCEIPGVLAGNSYQLPYCESFADGKMWSFKGGDWYPNDNTFGFEAYDGDNGVIAVSYSDIGGSRSFSTGKIDLRAARKPYFSFYTYNLRETVNDSVIYNDNFLEVQARELGDTVWSTLLAGTVDSLCGGRPKAWSRIRVSLDAFKGKRVMFRISETCKSYYAAIVDRLMVAEETDHNLGMLSLTAPDTVRFGRSLTLAATVENQGLKPASGYTVEFYRQDSPAPFCVVAGPEVAPDGKVCVEAHDTLGISKSDAQVRYHAVVRYEADTDSADNTSPEVVVVREYLTRPVPTGLRGEAADGAVALEWNAPTVDGGFSGYLGTDDFEGYTEWRYDNVGDWTFIDADQKGIGMFSRPTNLGALLLKMPNNPIFSKRAFVVIPGTGWYDIFPAHSGKKLLGSLTPDDRSAVDDWLVSPLLDGRKQAVTVYARSALADYPECIELLYSTTGKETSNFVLVKEVDSIPAEWTAYAFEVPEGARYFAVRHKGTGGSMLMLDDISFTPAPMLVTGYKLYRDDRSVGGEPTQGTAYTDPSCPGGKHSYHVTALYNDGLESGPSNAHEVTNGVASIPAGVMVEGGRGYIAIAGAQGMQVSVFSAAGLRCFSAVPESNIRIPLQPGVYIVRVGRGAVKVIVRS